MKTCAWIFCVVCVLGGAAFFVIPKHGNAPDTNAFEKSDQLLDRMIRVTKGAIQELESLDVGLMSERDLFKKVQEVSAAHRNEMNSLGQQLDALPSHQRFAESEGGKQLVKTANEELGRFRDLCFRLTKAREDEKFSLGKVPVIEGKLPDAILLQRHRDDVSRKQRSKHDFIRTFLLGVTNFSEEQKAEMLKDLDATLTLALGGNVRAQAHLDSVLETTLTMYPTNHPVGQLNLGVLYSDLGDRVKAEFWLEKAANAGLESAKEQLKSLQKSP